MQNAQSLQKVNFWLAIITVMIYNLIVLIELVQLKSKYDNRKERKDLFNIDYTSREPIYEQLYNNVIHLISIGVLEKKQQLPPVRQLALQLNVNPNTVSKAYKNLEQDGIIYSVVGKGSFVMDNVSVIDSKKSEVLKETSVSVTNAMKLGIKKDEIIDIVDNIYAKEMKKE